jgi:hypothetical protein
MKKRKKTKAERVIFDSIRKPVAPPSIKFTDAKAEARTNPAQRKAKHKKNLNSLEEE